MLGALTWPGRAGRTAFAAPALDEAHVSSGRDAQLGGTLTRGGTGPGVVPGQALARVPGQQVGAPGGDVGQFGKRGGLALRGGRSADGVPAVDRDGRRS